MLNPDDLTAELPAPRDDEPENLRGDIRDELTDHLHCAMRRELLSGNHRNDEKQAWSNVLKKFGNPASVALQCWLIKMKGKMIMQKLTFAALLVAVALCGVMVWSIYSNQQQSQQFNKSMLDKLEDLVTASKQQANQPTSKSDTQPSGWPRFKIHVVTNNPEQTPLVSQEIHCTGNFLGAMPSGGGSGQGMYTPSEQLSRTTDSNGDIDFGYVHPGAYDLQVTMPWGAWLFNHEIRVAPGYSSQTIVCPDTHEYRKMELKLYIPTDLQQEDLSYFFNAHSREPITNSSGLLAGTSMTLKEINGVKWYFPDDSYTGTSLYIFNSRGVLSNPVHENIKSKNPWEVNKLSAKLTFQPVQDFYLYTEKKKSCHALIVYWGNPNYQNQDQMQKAGANGFIRPKGSKPGVMLQESSTYLTDKNAIEFDPQKDPSNTWIIKMNDDFWKLVRKETKTAKTKAEENKNTVEEDQEVPSSGGLF